jgi:hypothetical protein
MEVAQTGRRVAGYCGLVLREGVGPLWRALDAMSLVLPISLTGLIAWLAAGDVLVGLVGAGLALLVIGAVGSYRAWDKADDAATRLLELQVPLGSLDMLEPKPDSGATGWLLIVPSARFTNRSPDSRASLGIRLVVDVLGGHVELDEESGRKWKQVPPEQAPFLITPLAVEPQSSQAGKLGFWLSPMLGDLVTSSAWLVIDGRSQVLATRERTTPSRTCSTGTMSRPRLRRRESRYSRHSFSVRRTSRAASSQSRM